MDPQKLSAQELVQLCLASQDPAPWYELVRRFQPLIAGVVKKTLRHWPWIRLEPALVDDLTQDTFIKLCANDYRALRDFEFEHENSLHGFLKKTAAHVVHDYVRKTYAIKRPESLDQEDLEKASTFLSYKGSFVDDPHTQILLADIQRILEEALKNSPNRERDITIYWLYFRFGVTAKQISRLASIGLSVKGVESTLLRLIRLIRGGLGGDQEPPPPEPKPPKPRPQDRSQGAAEP